MRLLLDTHAFLWAISGPFILVSADAAFTSYGCPLQNARRRNRQGPAGHPRQTGPIRATARPSSDLSVAGGN